MSFSVVVLDSKSLTQYQRVEKTVENNMPVEDNILELGIPSNYSPKEVVVMYMWNNYVANDKKVFRYPSVGYGDCNLIPTR